MNQYFRFGALIVLCGAVALGDFSYKETSQITGGAMLRFMKMVPGGGKATQPTDTHFYLKGNRLATATQDVVQILDLDKETMTDINLKEKTYSVITFDEMKRAMEEAARRTRQQVAEASAGNEAQIDFKVEVKETGNRKQVSGAEAREFNMLLGWTVTDAKSGKSADMAVDSDMWMVPEPAGYDEVKRFYLRMAEKMAWVPGSVINLMSATQPNMREGMARMAKEVQKMDGIPAEQVTRMKLSGEGGEMPDLPELQFPGLKEEMSRQVESEARYEASRQASRAAGGRFGGLAGSAAGGVMGGMMRKKKSEAAPEPEKKADDGKKSSGVLIEVTSNISGWSTAAVDPSRFAVPAGFKEVPNEMKKLLK